MISSISNRAKAHINSFVITAFIIVSCLLANFSILSSTTSYRPKNFMDLNFILKLPSTFEIAITLSIFLILFNFYVFKHRSMFKFLPFISYLILLIIYVLLFLQPSTSYPEFDITYLYLFFIAIPLSWSIFILLSKAQVAHPTKKDIQIASISGFIFLLCLVVAFVLTQNNYFVFDYSNLLVFATCIVSSLLTLAHLIIRRYTRCAKTVLTFISRMLFIGLASVGLLGVWIPSLHGSISQYECFFQDCGDTSFFIQIVGYLCGVTWILLSQLNLVLPVRRPQSKAITIASGIFFYAIFIASIITTDVARLLSYNGNIFVNTYSSEAFSDFGRLYIAGYINIALVISFLCLLLLIIYLLLPRPASFLKRSAFYISIILCLSSIIIAFYINGLRPFDFYSGGRAGGGIQDMYVNNIQITFPGASRSMIVNQSYILTLKIASEDGYTPLNQLKANFNGTTDSIQNLLGAHNTACINVSLEGNSDQFNVSTNPISEYPLDQQSITWNWIITPKQTGQQILLPSASVEGQAHCDTKGQVLKGPYSLAGISAVLISIENPNVNILTRTLQNIDVGAAITTALGALLVSFIGWVSVGVWKRIRARTHPGKPEKKRLPTNKRVKKHK